MGERRGRVRVRVRVRGRVSVATAVLRGLRSLVLLLALPAALVGLWWFASAGSTHPYFPPLSEIYDAFRPTWEHRVLSDVLPSLLRLGVGLSVAIVAGVAGGVLLGQSQLARTVSAPLLEFARAVPPPVLVPALMLVLGLGDTMRIGVIALACLWPVLLNTVMGVSGLEPGWKETARALRLSGRRRLTTLILPGAAPQVMTGIRQALSIGIIVMVISEMFAARDGIGHAVVVFQRTFALTEMWTGILLLGLLGMVLTGLLALIESRVLRWHRAQHPREPQRPGVAP
ncbi:ABC transporter permease [Bogoriella caseilytica]|uniref:ABC-type nitrate/sulfonate/bicarbonate transport system permease component n=1 Tax=Bogoriella caseilytica TaxID=56055 RepID=A0A3N2BGK5_9MICO|nr:ABC transporter permease subunit [Bogoriella caseilytica]ROR74391.1 ABC-type nitrate/sulfonate/bicarbonate transport system permease component [Bogoriella caseilytica]